MVKIFSQNPNPSLQSLQFLIKRQNFLNKESRNIFLMHDYEVIGNDVTCLRLGSSAENRLSNVICD